MKQICLSIVSILVSIQITFAQQSGNINRAKGNTNYNYELANSGYNYDYDNGYEYSPHVPPEASFEYYSDSTVILEVDVMLNAEADEYIAILSLNQLAESLPICNQLMNERVEGFLNDLLNYGIGRESCFIDFVSQVPTYDYEIEKKVFSKTAQEVPTGFELKKNLHIRYTEPYQLDEMMVIAAQHEIYDLVKVDYIINNAEVLYNQMRKAAAENIQSQLEVFSIIGFDVSPEKLFYTGVAEEMNTSYPISNYNSYTAYSSTSLNQGYKNTYDIKKPVTYFYDRINYENYDVVLNPSVLEPAVQFSYNMKVKYVFKRN